MNEILSSILTLTIPFFIGMILEHFFSITQRITRLAYLIVNSKAESELIMWIECENNFDSIKKEIEKLFEKDIEKIRSNNNTLMEIKFKNFNLSIRKHNNGIYIFTLEKISAGIRDLKGEIREFVHKMELFKKKITTCQIKNLSVDLYLPYYWKSVKTIKVKGYEVKDYNIEYKNEKLKSHVSVSTKKINLKNTDISDLSNVFNDFISVF
jgi:hypothetical protein